MNIFLVALAVYFFNLPFGYWRSKTRKFSLQWFLAIHAPIPFVILLRIYSGIGFEFITYPIFVTAFFAGQFTGSRFIPKFQSQFIHN